jgi:Tfp pilus assembly protein PilN
MPLLDTYYSVNQAVGISVTTDRNGQVGLDGCAVMVKDKTLYLEKKLTGMAGVAELGKQFDTSLPVSLNISGKGVLYKQLPAVETIGPDEFAVLLPNAVWADFYVQHVRSGDISFAAIIRRSEADTWIASLTKLGFRVLMLSLGPFPVRHILPQLNVYNEEVVFNGNRISRDAALNWTGFRYEEPEMAPAPFPLKLENEPIDQRLVIPYAAVFQLVLAARLNPVQARVPALEAAFKDVLEDKKIRVKAFVVLLACLLVLLCNFLVFSWLEQANEKLAGQVNSSAQSLNERQRMSTRINKKERLLRELGWDGGGRKSVRVDAIASLLPREITWQEVAVNPVDERESRNKRSLQFADRRITVKGICPQIIPVNEWIARIKSRAWVKNVQLESYEYNNELNTGVFTLLITY